MVVCSGMVGESMSGQKNNLLNRSMISILFVLTFVFSAFHFIYVTHRAHESLSANLIHQAKLISDSIDPKRILALSGSAADVETPDYLLLKRQLACINRRIEECKFVYLMGRKESGELFFFVDNEPVGSEDESSAGQIYEDASDADVAVFEKKLPAIIGPQQDEWGTWVSAEIPIIDPDSGRMIALLGMDVDAGQWKHMCFTAARPVVLLMSTITVMLMIALILLEIRREALTKSRLHLLEVVLTALLGLVFTAYSTFSAHTYENVQKRHPFRQLAESKISTLKIMLHALDKEHIDDVELDRIAKSLCTDQNVSIQLQLIHPDAEENVRDVSLNWLRSQTGLPVFMKPIIEGKNLFVAFIEEGPGFSKMHVTHFYWLILLFGLSMTVLATAIVGLWTRRHERLEMLIAERSADLLETNRQLELAVEESGRLAGEARQANLAKGEFLANMSHEIRTPMNGILGMIHLVLSSELNEKQRIYLEKAQVSARSLMGILNGILDHSKIEAGSLVLESIDFRVKDVIDSTVGILQVVADEKGISLAVEVGADVPRELVGDPLRLGQILNNLCSNSIKFTAPGGSIHLNVDLKEETTQQVVLQFEVQDSGIGIPYEQQQHLFQAFSQGDSSTTRKYGGTGLGLIISKNLIHMMGGRIWLESELGKGSVFYFTVSFNRKV